LILLNDPSHHALLCVEEPENQLYPQLLSELAEEFRLYSVNEGQVFISTHSPDFLDAVELDELYCLVKNNGFTEIKKASNNDLIKSLFESGDLLGDLWRQGLLEKVL
ncbi:MAG: AAA family ATPase, partial [Firmicutes bacterium]|nr:AAA family ATPase [Bacillota bacterium]